MLSGADPVTVGFEGVAGVLAGVAAGAAGELLEAGVELGEEAAEAEECEFEPAGSVLGRVTVGTSEAEDPDDAALPLPPSPPEDEPEPWEPESSRPFWAPDSPPESDSFGL